MKIYIVITHTGTILSNVAKVLTNKKYNHASIALDRSLDTMYSFGRLNPYNPFWGGFVVEGKDIGTFKRFKNTITKVFSFDVSDEQYNLVIKNIENIQEHKSEYKFNVIGLAFAAFKKYKKINKGFYCSEFVKYILENSKIDVSFIKGPPLPMSFEEISGLELLYTGLLRDYR